MIDMEKAQIKLQDAFNKGFVPADLKKAMASRGHNGQVWVTETQAYEREVETGKQYDNGSPIYKTVPSVRLGVGYKFINDDGEESDQIHWYEEEDVEKLLKEI